MNFVDTLAETCTTAASVDGLLEAEEKHHGNEKVSFKFLNCIKVVVIVHRKNQIQKIVVILYFLHYNKTHS